MGAVRVIRPQPRLHVSLAVIQASRDLFPERHTIELVSHRLVKPLTDPIGRGTPCLGPGRIDILDGQIEFVFMAVGRAAGLRAPIGEDARHWNRVWVEEREHTIIQEVRCGDGGFRSSRFAKPTLQEVSMKVC